MFLTPRRQLAVAEDVCSQLGEGSRQILGLMVESNLAEGKQNVVPERPLVLGQSITDPCLGTEDTTRLLEIAAGKRCSAAASSTTSGG